MKKFLASLALMITTIFLATSVYAMTVTFTCDPNTEADLAGYKIYKSDTHGGPYTLVNSFAYGPGVEPIMVVPDLTNNKRIYFVATAFDVEGLESEYSNEVNVSSNDNRPPQSPILRIFRWILSLFTGNSELSIIDIQPS